MLKRIIRSLNKKRAFRLINGRLCGPKHFEKKRKLLMRAGYEIGQGTKVVGPIFVTTDLKIGENCWIGAFFKRTGNGSVEIGNNVDVAPEVSCSTGSHFVGDESRRAGKGFSGTIMVDDCCWIGQRSLILANVHIEKGCVVGAGSVLTKSIDQANILIAGVPAKFKKEL